MKYQDIYSIANFCNRHIIGLTKGDPNDYTPFYELKLYGIPDSFDEEKAEEAIFDSEVAVPLGTISGWMMLGEAIYRNGEMLSYIADAADEELEFAVSALLENNGPLNSVVNYFHILNFEISDKNVIPEILENLSDMLFTHCHVYPDIISVYPEPREHHENLYDKINKDIAQIAYADIINRKENVTDEPRLALSDEQINILLGKRNSGDIYSEQYKDHEKWDPFENAGFQEWQNTRVLFWSNLNGQRNLSKNKENEP